MYNNIQIIIYSSFFYKVWAQINHIYSFTYSYVRSYVNLLFTVYLYAMIFIPLYTVLFTKFGHKLIIFIALYIVCTNVFTLAKHVLSETLENYLHKIHNI